MRAISLCFLVSGFALVACEESPNVESKRNAVSDDESLPGEFLLDPPFPGAEPLPPRHEGPPLPAPAVDPEYVAKREAFTAEAQRRLLGWKVEGLPEPEIEDRYRKLKMEMLPPHPPPPPDAPDVEQLLP